ncbi:hypothetical protein O6H91_22G005100 [Diphasiastrum complanatum]|uniref:Uncharacterized protein n=1 Tax=Diphasiastrum complanatum TaxID=34168 RepID=A0ACC2ACL6_DIPCM|nr:hypothetical protein O6H91_22G005100 [Diphasiastrum complanatum]
MTRELHEPMDEDPSSGEARKTEDSYLNDNQQAHFPEEFSPDFLKLYYGRLFPFDEMHKWLSYGHDGKHPGCDSTFFSRREFSFTLEHDIYVRYLSFRDVPEMETAFRDKCPHKIDIGSIYNVDPAKRMAYAHGAGDSVFSPVEKELVFDVDMTDYDDMRTCCSGADICSKCWPLMTITIKVLDTALREDFGFQHILWVYSGRRGVHCWVCDSRARRLSNEQRCSVADYFHVYKGNQNNNKKVTLSGAALHPSLSRAYTDVLKPYFEEQILPNQSLLSSEEHYEKILQMIPDDAITSQMRDRWQGTRRSSSSNEEVNLTRWRQLRQALELSKKNQMLRRSVEEIIFAHTYPRLDLEVSKHMNHLLKSPFCIHPKTGRVCVPIDPDDCDNFDPSTVPTLSQLLNELNNSKSNVKGSSKKVSKDWERTSLAKSICFFRTSFLEPLLRSCKLEIEAHHQGKIQELAGRPTLNW